MSLESCNMSAFNTEIINSERGSYGNELEVQCTTTY